MKAFLTLFVLWSLLPAGLFAQSSQLIPGRLNINGAVPPGSGHNISLRSDASGNNVLEFQPGGNGSAILNLESSSAGFAENRISMYGFSTDLFPVRASWDFGAGANFLFSGRDFEIVQSGTTAGFFLDYITAFSIGQDDLSTTIRNISGPTLALESGGNPASLLIKAFENGIGQQSDYAGFEWIPNSSGTELSLNARSFDDTGVGPISSLTPLLGIQSNGDLLLKSGIIRFDTETIGDGGLNNVAIRGDVIPNNAGLRWDLGNHDIAEHWDEVNALSFVVFSDASLKNNVRDLDYGLQQILALSPKRYQYENDLSEEQDRLGLIAQEVQQIIPEVVVTHDVDGDENGELVRRPRELLGINYVALIPILIQGMQEQEVQLQRLREDNVALTEQVHRLSRTLNQTPVDAPELGDLPVQQRLQLTGTAPLLAQNVPNPAHRQTTIAYFLPRADQTAVLHFYDLQGKPMQSLSLPAQKGPGEVQVDLNILPAGTYSYSLVIGGEKIGTRMMVVVE